MKKQTVYWLILTESVFAALLIGFFLGQNLNRSPVQASQLSIAAYTSETASVTTSETAVLPRSGVPAEKVNINTATSEELQTLPGIGPTLAQQIIDYRNEHGPFSSLLELANVNGIGVDRITRIMDYATVGG
ncbi:MAG: ComEA family DNA-binding protein [Oscillospiraceae bacterium]|nr:ComEA family DNA-binding protein [Oscillospiraceae bacterium]